jgi:hypothetical protein
MLIDMDGHSLVFFRNKESQLMYKFVFACFVVVVSMVFYLVIKYFHLYKWYLFYLPALDALLVIGLIWSYWQMTALMLENHGNRYKQIKK